MRKIFPLILLLLLTGCGLSEDCIRNSGTVIVREIETQSFEKIFVNPGISVVVSQGDYHVAVQAGENFIETISVKFDNGTLRLNENSGCNWVREHGQTVVYVTAPNITEIYSNSDRNIVSQGTLTFPILRLYAMDIFGGVGTGDFYLTVNNSQLVIESNNISSFHITGHTNEMLLNFYDDLGRFEGADFQAESIHIFQRSANDMIVHPVQSLTGDIYSTGNVRSVTHPPTVQVTEHYTGRLIFD